jgi:dienelactone hydrolase
MGADTTATPLPVPGRPITFTTPDGVVLNGTLYGQGPTAVIFSPMSDQRQASWAAVAQDAARAGYLALTFDFRFWRPNGGRDLALMNVADQDLLAAVAYVRAEGAAAVALVGASLGGMASAKAAGPAGAAALVVISAPLGHPDLEIEVTSLDLAAARMPKLFIAALDDPLVPAEQTRAMFDVAPEPKTWLTYPAAEHGTALLATSHGPDLRQRLLDFLLTHAPVSPP